MLAVLVCLPDKDLETPLTLKAQSPSTSMSEKAEEEELLEAGQQFGKEPRANLLIKESPQHCACTSPDTSLQISEERWALDALRNGK